MTPAPAAPEGLDRLRAEAAHLRHVNEELLATVAELRATVERQQAHIDRLVRMTFGLHPFSAAAARGRPICPASEWRST
jgi:hypothetical protein